MTSETTAGPVRLRHFTLADCEIADATPPTPEDDRFSWFGFPVPGRLRAMVESGGFPGPGDISGRLAVEVDGEYAGTVSWHPKDYGPIQAPALSFGIGLLPPARGKGYGTHAQRLLVAYLFATTTVNRVEAGADVGENAQARSPEEGRPLPQGGLRRAGHRHGQ